MSFLKKLGQVIVNVAGIAVGVGPLLQLGIPKASPVIGTVTNDLQQIAGIIGTVEAIGQAATSPLPGAEKLKVATPLVAQAILASSLLAGKELANDSLFKQGAQKIADGMADVLNSIHEKSVKTAQPKDV